MPADAGTLQSTRALLRLRELLLGGEFAPASRMSELPLVERLGVSRTPLRLALARLEHEGLLDLLPGGGYAVRAFTHADIHDAIELRGVLEGTAARFAAEAEPDAERLSAMHALNREIDAVVRVQGPEAFYRYVDLNERFHGLLHELADSPVLARALDGVMSLPFASPSAFVLAQAELPASREILVVAAHHHRELVGAVEGHQGSRAEAILREHSRLASRNLDVVLRHRELLAGMPGASLVVPGEPSGDPPG